MSYGPNDIETLTLIEAIKRRPGMYLGDLGHLGTARLIDAGTQVLAALCICRDAQRLWFSHHAFLDVTLRGRNAEIGIEHHPAECPDIADRCAWLVENGATLRPGPYDLEQGPNDVAPFALLDALGEDLTLMRATPEAITPILGMAEIGTIEPKTDFKGAFVGLRFHIGASLDPSGLSRDYLEGFLQGAKRIAGLVVRDVSVE